MPTKAFIPVEIQLHFPVLEFATALKEHLLDSGIDTDFFGLRDVGEFRTSELVREAAGGAVILIERRGQPVAELRPISNRRPKPPPLPAMSSLWRRFPSVPTDSGRFLEEDR